MLSRKLTIAGDERHAPEPTVLERRATNCEYKALLAIEQVIMHLRAAERALLEEERNHAPHVGIANQHKLIAYAEIVSDLVEVRTQIVQRLTGEPNPRATLSTSADRDRSALNTFLD